MKKKTLLTLSDEHPISEDISPQKPARESKSGGPRVKTTGKQAQGLKQVKPPVVQAYSQFLMHKKVE
jgi:hypothetical protein